VAVRREEGNFMGIEYYAFALFVSGLICLIAVLFRVLFADVKRQQKLLDEKETKLLQLYRTVENIMEEFADQAKATTDELKEHEIRLSKRDLSAAPPPEPAIKEPAAEKLPRSVTVDSSRIRAASEVLERAERIIKGDALKPPAPARKGNGNGNGNSSASASGGAVFQRFFDESVSELPEPPAAAVKKSRKESILELAVEGKTDAQIASELGITRNEVRLVIGLKKK